MGGWADLDLARYPWDSAMAHAGVCSRPAATKLYHLYPIYATYSDPTSEQQDKLSNYVMGNRTCNALADARLRRRSADFKRIYCGLLATKTKI